MATLDFSGLPAPAKRVPAEEMVAHHADGVILAPDDRVEDIAPYLENIREVTLTLPSFGDGRVYSQARRLRDQFGYKGRIRVVGDVLLDQIHFLIRCGITVLELPDGITEQAARKTLIRFSGSYQPAADGAASIVERRRKGAGAKR